MSSKYILVSRLPIKNKVLLDNITDLENTERKRYYFCEEQDYNEILELRSFNDIKELSWIEEELKSMFHRLSDVLSGDIKRELLTFIESPIDNPQDLPNSKYVQLRHVEVPADNYCQYRQWRDETIFNVVRENKDKIESFEALSFSY